VPHWHVPNVVVHVAIMQANMSQESRVVERAGYYTRQEEPERYFHERSQPKRIREYVALEKPSYAESASVDPVSSAHDGYGSQRGPFVQVFGPVVSTKLVEQDEQAQEDGYSPLESFDGPISYVSIQLASQVSYQA